VTLLAFFPKNVVPFFGRVTFVESPMTKPSAAGALPCRRILLSPSASRQTLHPYPYSQPASGCSGLFLVMTMMRTRDTGARRGWGRSPGRARGSFPGIGLPLVTAGTGGDRHRSRRVPRGCRAGLAGGVHLGDAPSCPLCANLWEQVSSAKTSKTPSRGPGALQRHDLAKKVVFTQ